MGTVTTGEPGTDAAVTNSGTPQDAVLDFTIPKGDTGSSGVPEVLAATDVAPQPSGANQPLVFRDNAVISGTQISHETNSPDIVISGTGIYQILFNSTVGVGPGVDIPAAINITLQQNGNTVDGGVARHIFTSSGQYVTVSFSAPVSVTSVPSTLNVVTDQANFLFSDLSITVFRLGDVASQA